MSYRLFWEIRLFKLFFIVAIGSTVVVLTIYYITNNVLSYSGYPKVEQSIRWISLQEQQQPEQQSQSRSMAKQRSAIIPEKYNEGELRHRMIRDKIKILTNIGGAGGVAGIDTPDQHSNINQVARLYTKNVHIFYSFPVHWYGQPQDVDHPNHTSSVRDLDGSQLSPHIGRKPRIIFYPKVGLYQPEIQVIEKHLRDIQNLGTNVLIVTWSPQMPQYQLRFLLDAVGKHGLQVALEIDAYANRTPASILNDMNFLYREYWFHDAFYKVMALSRKRMMPIVYIRDADAIADQEWWNLLSYSGPISIRRSLYNAIFIGHIR